MLMFLVVHSGLMELAFLEKNDAEHYLPELKLFRQHHEELRGVFLIQDGGSSHIAGDTQRYIAESDGWWRPRYTPANASWLNQAEILIHSVAFRPDGQSVATGSRDGRIRIWDLGHLRPLREWRRLVSPLTKLAMNSGRACRTTAASSGSSMSIRWDGHSGGCTRARRPAHGP